MLTYRQARNAALRELPSLEVLLGECVIFDYQTIGRDWGWLFFYGTFTYVESGELQARLVGNAPYLIKRYNGELRATGTAFSAEDYSAE